MDIKLVIAVISLITALILAYLNFRLSQTVNKSQKLISLQTQAYIDFVDAIAESAMSAQNNKKRTIEVTKKIVDAKTRISIYGDQNVIQKLANFDRDYGWAHDEASRESLMDVVLAMRDTSLGKASNSLRKFSSVIKIACLVTPLKLLRSGNC